MVQGEGLIGSVLFKDLGIGGMQGANEEKNTDTKNG
jgi:hypothetical protein